MSRNYWPSGFAFACVKARTKNRRHCLSKKSEVDANYVKLMKILMKSGVYHGLATHDENIINQAKAFATSERISRDAFEFQMLYGIRRDLQQSLVRDGWRMRVYIPFGTSGTRTSCGVWPNAQRMCSSLPKICCAGEAPCSDR